MTTEKQILAVKWFKDKRLRVSDSLYLTIRKNSKTYQMRKTVRGKQHMITLGHSPTMTLKQAKAKVAEIKKNKIVTNMLISTLISSYIKDIVEKKSKVPNQVIGYFNHADSLIGHVKVTDITLFELVEIIRNYSNERGARSGDRLRSYLKALFGYALNRGIIKDNPLQHTTKEITGYTYQPRTKVLTNDEILMVWNWKNNDHGWQKTEENKRVIQFLLLTGLRISEAQKGYMDGDFFRVDDTKGKHSINTKRPHWVYLTDTAKALLPLPKCTATNIQAWLKRKLISEGFNSKEQRFTAHDCRRTFVTRLNESKNNIEPYVVEKCVNHKLEGMLAVYNQAEYKEQRIEAFKEMEKLLLEIVSKNSQ